MSSSAPLAAAHPTFAEACRVWLRIGLTSFGGPAGQIALMHKVLVEEKAWVEEGRFLHALNFCMLLPGPEAQQLATYIGWLLHGVRGGLVAGTLFVLPGFCVILTLSVLYALFSATAWLSALFFGLKAAVLAVVIEAVLRLGKRALKNDAMRALAALSFVAIFAFDAPFPLIVLLAGVIGYFGARMAPAVFRGGGHGPAGAPGPALAVPVAPTLARSLGVATTGLALWAAPVLALGLMLGWGTVFTPIAAFFSKMAVVTFGGAYAVLSYVAQQAVEHYHWLKPGEMLDGLALAETTPGPLILVLTHVGFLAAFREPGGLSPLLAGVMGAGLTTWVTFVPCFLWIFLGAPYIERLAANRALSGALAAVSAAVVGVILNLALWFGLHVLFAKVGEWRAGPLVLPLPELASLDAAALALALVAVLALFRLRLGMVATLALCGGLGLVARLPLF